MVIFRVSIYVTNDGNVFPQKVIMEESTSTLCTAKQYKVKGHIIQVLFEVVKSSWSCTIVHWPWLS